MRSRHAAVLAAVALTVTTGLTAAAATSTDEGPSNRPGSVGRMMTDPDARPGTMHGVRVTTEHQYLVEMVAHHREAVAAARELRRSDRVDMRGLGQSIVTTQSAQIDQMQKWLKDWYPTRSGEVDYEPMMRDLTELSGDRLDRAFLQDMVMHHRAAVMMSQQLLVRGLAEHPPVAALARTIGVEQRAEIHQMQRWLREWFGQDWQHRPDRGRGHGGAHRDGCTGVAMMA